MISREYYGYIISSSVLSERQQLLTGRNVLGMSLQALDACLVLVVPDLDLSVVRPRDEVGLVAAVVIVHAVDALLVAFQGEVR